MSAEDNEDEEFMEKLNVYLNSRESMEGNAVEGILRRNSSFNKTVKFAMDEEDLEDARLDNTRSRQDLLDKISRLNQMLKDAEQQMSVEREKRKKKEKNLLKLAKELKKRNAQKEADMARMEELEEKKQYLEHHWILAGKELDQEKILREKLQKEHEADFQRTLNEEKDKHASACKKYEQQIDDLKLAHSKQCEELGKEILKANLEADRLHNQLIGAPRQTKLFSVDERPTGVPLFVFVASMLLVLLAFSGHTNGFFTVDTLCSPIIPGRTLGRANTGLSFEAPWWVPNGMKDTVFQQVCSKDHRPTLLEWLPDGKDSKVILSRGDKAIFKKNAVVKLEVFGDHLRTWNRKGMAEEHESVWSLDS